MEINNKKTVERHITSDMPIKPVLALDALFDAIKPISKPFELLEGENLSIQAENPILWFFTEGLLTVIRKSDELHLQSARAKFIYGIAEAFQYRGFLLVRAEMLSKGYYISTSEFIKVINHNELWSDVAEVLSYYINMLVYRDQQLVGSNTYTIIRHKLIELMTYSESFRLKPNNSAFRYIQQRTNISRSNIFKILSELNKGSYILIEHGQLMKVYNLPSSY